MKSCGWWGDDAILRSDIESQRLYLQNEGQRFDGDPIACSRTDGNTEAVSEPSEDR